MDIQILIISLILLRIMWLLEDIKDILRTKLNE